MKRLLIVFFSFLSFALAAQPAQPNNTVPDSLFTGFASRLEHVKPIYLDIQAGEKSADISIILKQTMLAEGFELTDKADSSAYTLEVKLDQSDELLEVKKFWGYKRYQISKSRYLLQLLDPGKKILAFTHYEVNGQPYLLSEGYTGKMKWYDPILLFAIIGSLVYIIWTTN